MLLTFIDPNTLATVADVNAQLAVGGWGDGTPTASGINLVVQEIGVTPLTAAATRAIRSSRFWAATPTPRRPPRACPTPSPSIVTTLGGASTTLTTLPGGGVTVIDARLTSSNGTEITGVEGTTTGTVLLGSFTDANPTGPLSDFTATIAWGATGTGSTPARSLSPAAWGRRSS